MIMQPVQISAVASVSTIEDERYSNANSQHSMPLITCIPIGL